MITYKKNNEGIIRCPNCLYPPPKGSYWRCDEKEKQGCGFAFDTFQTGAICPRCGRKFSYTQCPICGNWAPYSKWFNQ